ncbi:MAG: glutamate--tRNA ligase [Bacteroidetes bacterium]|nr:MAG: glutamate--tRNA ligase [Bacteroidota bacterium]
MSEKEVRVRFAPSPTGPLHIGGVRTALFNYLFAKKNNGKFILRIEDTDQTRYVPGAEDYIVEALKWCNIDIDEGATVGGDYGPYRQSERKDLYKQYSDVLIERGNAYYAFDTPEELDSVRKKHEDNKQTFIYNASSRNKMNNSFTLSDDVVKKKIGRGEKFVVRFKMPDNEDVIVSDIIRGKVVVNSSLLDDKILFKSDGMPTYHLANIVDDYLMKISHVIRGEEWLPSLPLHVLLYRAFGWEEEMPEFAHLPLILKPVGKGKLSKRDGDKLGFPVFPIEWKSPNGDVASGYRESGYFSEAFINMLALLGWNPGTEQEIFSIKELSKIFSLERVGKSGSRFDPDKAKWYNHHYLVEKSNEEIADLFQDILKEKGIEKSNEYVAKVCGLVKERVNFVSELWEQTYFFFQRPVEYDKKTVKKRWKENSPNIMKDIINILSSVELFNSRETETVVKKFIEEKELGMGQVMNAFRLTIVGAAKGPGVFDIIELLGKDETIKRIELGIKNIAR